MAEISEYIGVYDADSTIIGEISYWIGARLGRRHCSLCDITHGLFTIRSDWTEQVESLGVPFVTFHRNDAPDDVLAAADGSFPVVLARISDGLRIALDREDLDQLDGSPERFVARLIQHRPAAETDPDQ